MDKNTVFCDKFSRVIRNDSPAHVESSAGDFSTWAHFKWMDDRAHRMNMDWIGRVIQEYGHVSTIICHITASGQSNDSIGLRASLEDQ
ncbi:hypothetical protein PanWU01x14_151560 [Parasponia andersonii]|uniref:Uncharacterized protein n=1 Tax=Parasponia andersonii TaxID=3476 RepID=A0A2P5CHN7_PARAD|nr:hypothetical protein PanWU01x14_151560 [Parasponia andersonii]